MADELELRWRIRELLVPGARPVGEPGNSRGDIRMVQGSLEAARDFLNRFRELGEPVNVENYPGEFLALGGEGRVGLRRRSKSGPSTIDVNVKCVPEVRKTKFV